MGTLDLAKSTVVHRGGVTPANRPRHQMCAMKASISSSSFWYIETVKGASFSLIIATSSVQE